MAIIMRSIKKIKAENNLDQVTLKMTLNEIIEQIAMLQDYCHLLSEIMVQNGLEGLDDE